MSEPLSPGKCLAHRFEHRAASPTAHWLGVLGGWEEGTREPPEAWDSLSVLHRAPLGWAALSSKEACPSRKKGSLKEIGLGNWLRRAGLFKVN